jgi:hypothetical protein
MIFIPTRQSLRSFSAIFQGSSVALIPDSALTSLRPMKPKRHQNPPQPLHKQHLRHEGYFKWQSLPHEERDSDPEEPVSSQENHLAINACEQIYLRIH